MKEILLNTVENIVSKGEIAHYAHYEQFHLLKKCFQKSSAAEASESVYMWERVKIRSEAKLVYMNIF